MGDRAITKVEDYINIINDLTNNQAKVVQDQIDQLRSLSDNSNLSNDLTQYYKIVAKEKEEGLKTIQLSDSNDRYDSKLNEHPQYRFYYRGHYKSTYELLPSVFRESSWNKEDNYYHEIMVHCPQHFQYSSHLDKLVTMQHYDCPTRLLDVTSNPLVALFFSCKNYGCKKCEKSDEGEVLVFPVLSREVVYSDSDRALMLSCLPRFSKEDKIELYNITQKSLINGTYKQRKGGSRYESDVVERFFHEITTELPSFKREIKPIDILQPLFVQPNKTNGRILKQDGAFIINGLSKDADEAKNKLLAIKHTSIKVKNQEKILKELSVMGINEASLFPEVDKVANYLKENL